MSKQIKSIYIHESASNWGNSIEINKWHLQRGWSGIGYHIVILNGNLRNDRFNEMFDGYIESGRAFDDDNMVDKDEAGAHVYGRNSDSIGICLIGKNGLFTENQFNSLWKVLVDLCDKFNLDISKDVYGHYQYDANKTCPGFDVPEWIKGRIKSMESNVSELPPSEVTKTKIKGYRDLNQEEIDTINKIKENGNGLGEFLDVLDKVPSVDKNWLAIARTDLQKGYMSLVRSIAKPEFF